MAMEFDLIPQGTLLQENGHGEAADIRASATRTFFCIMLIRDQIEQESVDVSIWGSADGENWGTQPFLRLPQQFYKGETRAVLELTLAPEVNVIRAAWELNRWGRVAPLPMFVLGLHLAEVPAVPLHVTQSHAGAAK
ncbi:MAG TPA: hypothetical protein VNZ56_14725 [Verrucomicrobiae bacterium]|jgi:hypothetical protein|nr:hypothetical protein [Verrucomicrobiae bacterium]